MRSLTTEKQTKFDDFLDEFKNERPHQDLDMKCPAGIYLLPLVPIAA